MEYEKLVQDFAYRTRKNLDALLYLKRTKPDNNIEVYEVTQLINSMLGLLVFPKERYFDKIPKTPLSELANQGWPISTVEGNYEVKDLQELVRYLRNAIVHCNLEFLSNEKKEITGLRVWNSRYGQTTWKASLTIEDIEKIAYRFIELILKDSNS